MRILTLSEHTENQGGREIAQLTLCRGLAERGHDVRLLYGRAGSLQPEWESFARARRMPPNGFKVLRRDPARTGAALAFLVATGVLARPQVVYVHARLLIFAGAAVAAAARCPLVVHLHDPPRPLDRQDRWAAGRVARWIAVSAFEGEAWAGVGVRPDRVTVVHNGVDLQAFRPPSAAERREARKALGLPADAFVVLFSGRITPDKGLDVLLAALDELRRRGGDRQVVGLVCGAPSAAASDRAYADGLRAAHPEPGTRWAGWLTDPREGYWAADAVAVPSRYGDPFPLVPLEAMACGVPVVASSAGGLPESVGLLSADLVVAVGDAAGLAGAIERLARGDGAAGVRALAERRFALPATVTAVEEVLADARRGRQTHG